MCRVDSANRRKSRAIQLAQRKSMLEWSSDGALAAERLRLLAGADDSPGPVADHDRVGGLFQDRTCEFFGGENSLIAFLLCQVGRDHAEGIRHLVQEQAAHRQIDRNLRSVSGRENQFLATV